jgi:hypothetical protein
MTYAVFAPVKTDYNTRVALMPIVITDDLDEAKKAATASRSRLQAKGFRHWAKQVTIKSPTTPAAYMDLASKVSAHGRQMDQESNGSSFKAQHLLNWANILRRRADELANPET